MVYPYLTLKVSETATNEEIRTAYLKLVHQFSPEHAPEKFQEINAAYELIKEEIGRAKLKLFGIMSDKEISEMSFLELLPKPDIKKIKIGVNDWIDANTK